MAECARSAAIILAGGRGSRLGGVDKASIVIDGRMLLEHVLDAVAGCAPIIVVGPPTLADGPLRERPNVVLVREDPPFTGPVAAVDAALTALRGSDGAPDDTVLLACDQPRAADIVTRLAAPIPPDADAAVLTDADGREQWLAGRYDIAALRSAVSALPNVQNASMRQLLTRIRLHGVPDETGAAIDLDTWAAIDHYRRSEEEHHG